MPLIDYSEFAATGVVAGIGRKADAALVSKVLGVPEHTSRASRGVTILGYCSLDLQITVAHGFVHHIGIYWTHDFTGGLVCSRTDRPLTSQTTEPDMVAWLRDAGISYSVKDARIVTEGTVSPYFSDPEGTLESLQTCARYDP